MDIFDLAAKHRGWLARSQSTIAENIANANTPGYKAQTVGDFQSMIEASAMSATHPKHKIASSDILRLEPVDSESSDGTHSGNTVDVDKELIAANRVRNDYSLNVSVVKAFQRMTQLSLRS